MSGSHSRNCLDWNHRKDHLFDHLGDFFLLQTLDLGHFLLLLKSSLPWQLPEATCVCFEGILYFRPLLKNICRSMELHKLMQIETTSEQIEKMLGLDLQRLLWTSMDFCFVYCFFKCCLWGKCWADGYVNMRPQLIFSAWKAGGMQGRLERISSVVLYIPGDTTIKFLLICHMFVYSYSNKC